MKRSDVVATAIVSASSAVLEQEGEPVTRAPALAVRRLGMAPHPQRQRRRRRRRRSEPASTSIASVTPPTAVERAAGERPDRKPDVPRRLDHPVRRLDAPLARDRRDERELGRLRDRDAAAEQRREREHQRRTASRTRARRRRRAWTTETSREQPGRLEAVDDEPDVAGQQRDRRPEGDEDRPRRRSPRRACRCRSARGRSAR